MAARATQICHSCPAFQRFFGLYELNHMARTALPEANGKIAAAPSRGAFARKKSPSPFAEKKARKPAVKPTWSKSVPVTLKPNSNMDDVIHVVVAACRNHWQKNIAAAIDGTHPEGLHQVRVALRRLRSALSAFKDLIPDAQRIALNQEAKWLLSELGAVRDLDVFVQELAAPLSGHLSGNADLVQVMRTARLAQSKAHARAARALQGTRAKRFVARLEAWVNGRGWRSGDAKHDGKVTPAADFAQRFLNRKLRKIRTTYDDVEALSIPDRHELRIAVKKIRYAIEFFHTLLPAKRVARLNGILKALQDSLGHLNDLDVAERTVGTLVNVADSGLSRRQIAAGGKAIGAWHKKAAAEAEPETFKLWRKLKKAPSF